MAWLASQPVVRKALHVWGMRPLGHSTLIWFREDPDCHTRLTMRNYLTMNYGIPNPVYRFVLLDADGQRVTQWERTARRDETLVVDSAALSKELGLGAHFEGTLGIEVQHPTLFPRRHLRANVDYYSPSRFNTTVHDQGSYIALPKRDTQTLVYVLEDDEYETGIVLQNGYRYRRKPSEFMAKATLELLDYKGLAISAPLAPFPAGGTRLVWLQEVFPMLREFLGGRPGGLRIRSNVPLPRSIPVIRSKRTAYLAVNHTVGDMDPALYTREMLRSTDVPRDAWAPIWSSLILESEEYRTVFAFFNNWLPKASYTLDIRLYDSSGNSIVVVPQAFMVRPNETYVLQIRELLSVYGVGLPFCGSVEARLTPRDDLDDFPGPGVPSVNTIWSSAQSITLSNNQSLWFANATRMPEHFLAPRRTKMFGRVVSNEESETWIALNNLSSDACYATPSETQIIITQASGDKRLERTVNIPGHGTFFASLDELFPGLDAFLRESYGVSSLLIVDKRVKLIGYLMLRNKFSGAIGIDHLFGG
jgi:hypothetical protein